MHVRCRQAIVTVQNGVLEVVKSGKGNNFAQYLAYAATPSWRAAMPLWVISGHSNTSDVRLPAESGHSPTSSRFANPGAAQTHCPYSSGNAEKKPEEYPGFKTLKLNRSSLRELAKCLSGTRLEGLRGRKRNFLSKHCEFLGLLGQRFELLA